MPHAQKRLLLVSLVTALWLCSFGLGAVGGPAAPTSQELAAARAWVDAQLGGRDDQRPFSFHYGGAPSSDLLGSWKANHESRQLDENRREQTLIWQDDETGLVVRCVAIVYRDYPVVEWTLYLRNSGDAATPILSDIQSLDVAWQRGEATEFLLHHAVGSPANGSDYGPLETPLTPGVSKRISAAGGRPTNSDLCYFNLQWGARGVILAIGWPGQWAATFKRDNAQQLAVRAGQELTHFTLLPGEEVRTPLIALLFWQGDRYRAQNLWRRWMMAHSMPHPGGKLPPPQFVASSSRAYEEMIGANEANQIMHIDRYLEERLKIDYWWMDAGWYVQQRGWPQVGTWEVDPKRFPRGLRPISDHAHANGLKTLVWFEPERVTRGTWLYEQHPEWLLRPTPGDHPLAGLCGWSSSKLGGSDPCVTHNPTPHTRSLSNIRWKPGHMAFHPGPKGEYSAVRFVAPADGAHMVRATFEAIDSQTTTEVHVLLNGKSLFTAAVRGAIAGQRPEFQQPLTLAASDRLDFIVDWSNGSHVCDSTGLAINITSPTGKSYDAAAEFNAAVNPTGPWCYGFLPPGDRPKANAFVAYDRPTEAGDQGTRLLNLGLPDARNWLLEHIDNLITEQGIDLYRQDFNIDPLAFWRAADAEDRQGITEIRYVTGLLAYWDSLRSRHPEMLIDTCASGGRRNDLETLRRAVPLWRSDYAFEPIGHQCMTYGISFWIPYHGTGTVACANAGYYGGGLTPVEPYAFWSNAAPSLGSGIDIRVREINYDALRRLVHDWRNTSQYYFGDYFPLTDYSRADDVWIAWQFHSPEQDQGMIQVFRRGNCLRKSVRLKLRGLQEETRYRFDELETGSTFETTGARVLRDGLDVTAAMAPGVVVMVYQAVEGE